MLYNSKDNQFFMEPARVDTLRLSFPKGTRVELVHMDDPYTNLEQGDKGTVTHIDDAGTIFVAWDRGSGLGLIYGVDVFKVIS